VGDAVTGVIQVRPGEPAYKIVDGTVRGNRIFFFVLHEDENDPEVKAKGGVPFHNVAQGTFAADSSSNESPANSHESRNQEVLTLMRCHAESFSNDLDLILECKGLVLLELPWTSTSFRRSAQFSRGGREK